MLNFLKSFNKHKTTLDKQIERIEQSEFNYVWEFRETKNAEVVVIYQHRIEEYEELLVIYLMGVIKGIPSRNKISLSFNGTSMEIYDIEVLKEKSISRGYGSILMEEGLAAAKQRGVKEVVGRIMTTDEVHYSRQVQFYEKLGFRIENELDLYLELE